ncbi:MAG: glycoside hydrolase family 43 protein [Candidatus Omnitrophica bacterium]|nr:glycoside hydrolase family 43 protein [Candidatus Omnitrophota bacterium]
MEEKKRKEVYLFASFRGNGEEGLHLAYSHDSMYWSVLRGDDPFLKPSVGDKLMRDPCVIRGPDGIFHMTWTTGWADIGIGVAHSKDLITWSEQKFIPVMANKPNACNCWAPEIIWNSEERIYMIYWASKVKGSFSMPNRSSSAESNHLIYYTATKDFKNYKRSKLLYNPGFSVIDATVIRNCNRYIMIIKDETENPPAKNLRISTSRKLAGPWSKATEPFSPRGLWVEGPAAIRVGNFWHVYFDIYQEQRYGIMRTKNFKCWEDISNRLKMPQGTRHGTVLRISGNILQGLLAK